MIRSARNRIDGEMARPSALAVFVLITNSNFVGSLDRNVGGLGAFEDLVDKDGDTAIERAKVRAVAEEPSRVGIVDEADRREAELDRKLRNLPEAADEA